jgi:hypothetical protein
MSATQVSGMLICTGSSVSRLLPFAVTPVKLTEPKLVSGRTPEVPDGASAMASADDRSAPRAMVSANACYSLSTAETTVSGAHNLHMPKR